MENAEGAQLLFAVNDVVFEQRPDFAVETISSRARNLCCDFCCRPLDWKVQVTNRIIEASAMHCEDINLLCM